MNIRTNNPSAKHVHDIAERNHVINNNSHDSRIDAITEVGPIIREIDFCLTECSKCNGAYVDAITGKILRIICRHRCHSFNNI